MSGDPEDGVLEYEPGVALDALEYVVVDVETTGGAPDRGHRITELAALRVDAAGRILEEYRTLVNPQRRIPPFVSHLTHITQDMVDAAPAFGEVAEAVRELLTGRVFVAHNAAFDWRFVTMELERAHGLGLAGDARVLCTVKLARRVVPELRRRSLDSLAYYFGVEIAERHRAYGDARATVEVFGRLMERVAERDVSCWNGLQALLARRTRRRRRTSLPTAMDVADATDQML